MKPSNIIPVNCMNDFRGLKEGQVIKRPGQKVSFEVYLGQVYWPGAACCGGGKYDPVVLRKENGKFIESRIGSWDPTIPKDLREGEIHIHGWSSIKEMFPGDEEFKKYDQIWKEAISK
ncbi:MAG: hypothetical protein ABIB79_03165 [archaeon]